MAVPSPVRFGRFELNVGARTLLADGQEVKLRPKSFDVLAHLVDNRGRVVTKDELAAALWHGSVMTDDSLVQCVRDVRAALGDDQQRLVRTVPRRGYAFVAGVEAPTTDPILAGSPDMPLPEPAGLLPAVPKATVPGADLRTRRGGLRAFAWLMVAMSALALLAAAAYRAADPRPPSRLTVAVLPLQPLGDPVDRTFSDGLSEDIITAVARFRDLTVIARSASFRRRDDADTVEVGRDLGAAFVLSGTVAREERRIRINVKLTDSRDGATRWAERYERDLDSPFEVQDHVARQVASQLVGQARLHTAERVRSRAPGSLETYELVLRARRAFVSFRRPAAIEAETLLERALQVAPEYAPAWELYSRVLLRFFIVPYDGRYQSPALAKQAYEAAAHAVALDPNLSAAHASLGYAQSWLGQFDAALASLLHAVELNPNDPDSMRNFAEVLGRSGDPAASIETFRRATALDSFTPPVVYGLSARAHNLMGQFEQAIALARQCVERAPDLPLCHTSRAIAAAQLGRADEARDAVLRVRQLDPKASIQNLIKPAWYRQAADYQRGTALLRAAGFEE